MALGVFGTPEQAAAMGAITVDVSVAGILKTLDQADRKIGGTFQSYDGMTLPW
jgi:norsolorinic acid ketoreductase